MRICTVQRRTKCRVNRKTNCLFLQARAKLLKIVVDLIHEHWLLSTGGLNSKKTEPQQQLRQLIGLGLKQTAVGQFFCQFLPAHDRGALQEAIQDFFIIFTNVRQFEYQRLQQI